MLWSRERVEKPSVRSTFSRLRCSARGHAADTLWFENRCFLTHRRLTRHPQFRYTPIPCFLQVRLHSQPGVASSPAHVRLPFRCIWAIGGGGSAPNVVSNTSGSDERCGTLQSATETVATRRTQERSPYDQPTDICICRQTRSARSPNQHGRASFPSATRI